MDIKALTKEIKSYLTTPERLLELARLDPQLARLIPKHRRNIPLALYRELARSPDMPTRAAVAKDPEAPLEVLEILARDRQWTVAKAIFGAKIRRKIAVPDSLFETVAAHKRHTVRQSVAEHYLCPPHVLERLSRDPAPEVRRAVAGNPKASAELLHQLAADPDDRVVWNVVGHVNTSDPTLDLLAEHPHPHTRQQSIYPYLSYSRKRDIPVERLVKLSHDPDREVLEYILRYRQTPTRLVEDILTRRPELLEIAPELYIRDGVVYGSLSSSVLEAAVEHHPDLADGWLERIARVKDGGIAHRLLAHPKLSPAVLENIARANLEHLAQLTAAPPAPNATSAEQKLFKDLRSRAAYTLAKLTTLETLPASLHGEILEALGKLPLRGHDINELLRSPHAAVVEFARGRTPEW